jgi:hypothetical protein
MPASDWEKYRKEYAVLYIFDKEGNHLVTNHWCAGTTSDTNQSLLRKKLEEMISELGRIEFSNIEVKPLR